MMLVHALDTNKMILVTVSWLRMVQCCLTIHMEFRYGCGENVSSTMQKRNVPRRANVAL